MQQESAFPVRWRYFMVFVVCAYTLAQLFADPYLRSWDSYYYVLQLDTLFKTGVLQYPDGNLLSYILYPLKYLGFGAENALRLWMAFSFLLYMLPLVWMTRRFKMSEAVLFLLTWALMSPTLVYISLGLPKMFCFLICFNFMFWLMLRGKGLSFAWAALACLAVFLHRSALVYVGVCVLYMLCANFSRRTWKKVFIAGALAVLGLGLYLWLWPYAVWSGDLTRLELEYMTPSIFSLVLRHSFPMGMKLELLLALVFMLLVLIKFRREWRNLVFPLMLLAVSFCPAFGPDGLNFGARFGILLPSMLLLSFIWLYDKTAITEKTQIPARKRVWIPIMICICFLASFRLEYGANKHRVLPYEVYEQVICGLGDKKFPMLIVSKAMHTFFKFKTGRPSFSFEPEWHWDKTQVWRLFTGASAEELLPFVSEQCKAYVEPVHTQACGGRYYPTALMREDCYYTMRQKVLEKNEPYWLVSKMQNDILNPHAKRPHFLYKKYKNEDPNDPFPACPPEGCVE